MLAVQPELAREQIATVVELSRATLKEMRGLVFELRPPELEEQGVFDALRRHVEVLCRVHPVAIDFEADGDVALPREVESELYRIAQEALANALKHAGARQLCVGVRADAKAVRLDVADDGCGFDPANAGRGKHLGLVSMRERAHGGELVIESLPGSGTSVRLALPVAG
jgi:signal transduction histidine kinase